MEKVELLEAEERLLLPLVLQRRVAFQRILENSLKNARTTFSNCLMIQGQAGTGKTTTVINSLCDLKERGIIHDYVRIAGHVTPQSLFSLFEETSKLHQGLPTVLVLDDCDFMMDQGCLELAKAAFDTRAKGEQNRRVYYQSRKDSGFKYEGYGIIITNNDLNPDRITVHQQALLDRVNLMCIDLKREDMFIYNAHLIEDYLNENEDGLSEEEIHNVVDLFKTDIRRWNAADAFARTRINFSVRLVKKFVDCIRLYGRNSWKDLSTIYQRLESAAAIADAEKELAEVTGVNVEARKEYINPKTGKPYNKYYVNTMIKQGKLPA